MRDLRSIVHLLRDQQWVSGTEISEVTGFFGDDLEQAITTLRARGLLLEHRIEQGYRLTSSVTLINESRLNLFLQEAGLVSGGRVSVVDMVDSTNTRLLDWSDPGTLHGRVCIAEYQSDGHGRQGRPWFAAGYQNLTLSLAWRIERCTTELSCVSLVAGLAVLNCLEDIGIDGLCLKWPNDVMSPVGKLAGILIETKTRELQHFHVVIGIGINIRNASAVRALVAQPVADLSTMTDSNLDRTSLVSQLLSGLSYGLEKLNRLGFSEFVKKWNKLDAYMGRAVIGTIGDQKIQGCGLGVDDSGAYQVRDAHGHIHRLISGEVRLRRVAHSAKSDHHIKIMSPRA